LLAKPERGRLKSMSCDLVFSRPAHPFAPKEMFSEISVVVFPLNISLDPLFASAASVALDCRHKHFNLLHGTQFGTIVSDAKAV
jgi:hypothetical protein